MILEEFFVCFSGKKNMISPLKNTQSADSPVNKFVNDYGRILFHSDPHTNSCNTTKKTETESELWWNFPETAGQPVSMKNP